MDPRSTDPGPIRGPGPWTVLDYLMNLTRGLSKFRNLKWTKLWPVLLSRLWAPHILHLFNFVSMPYIMVRFCLVEK